MEKLFKKAYEFAKEKHKHQKRKGTGLPYFVHIKDVVEILYDAGADYETMIVGALHDTLEDTDTTIKEIVELFGVKIAYMVDTLSEKKSLKYEDRKHMQALRIKNSTMKIKMVKCADCLSNLRDNERELQKSDDIWGKFNAPKHIIQKHQKEMIEALSELEGIEIYSQLKHVYNNVFNENAIYEEDNKK